MNKHHHLIKLIVVTAGLIALGIIGFKFVVKRNNPKVSVQYASDPADLQLQELSSNS